jgi:hypothetical protein
LPSWLQFTSTGPGKAKLTGTPPPHSGGTYQINLRATDGVDPPATQAFTLTVNEAPGINSPKSATFTIGKASTFTVTATGFPAPTLTETGTLPNGVSFHAGSGGTATISGTPAAGTLGIYNITLTATNVAGTATQGFAIRVVKPGG